MPIKGTGLSPQAEEWLMSKDLWRFDGEADWTEVRLYFETGRLQKIVHLDYFVELP